MADRERHNLTRSMKESIFSGVSNPIINIKYGNITCHIYGTEFYSPPQNSRSRRNKNFNHTTLHKGAIYDRKYFREEQFPTDLMKPSYLDGGS